MARLNVVFDFGAVLFGWEPAKLLTQAFPQRAGTPALAAALATQVFSHPDWQAFDAGRLSQTEVTHRTQARTGLDLSTLTQLIDTIGEGLQPVQANVAVVARLRTRQQAGEDIGLFFLSNMPAPYARVIERKHAFIAWFDDGIFSADVKLIKPEASIFELAAQQFGLHTGRTVFIDDSLPNIVASRAHGWVGVHLPVPDQLQGLLSGVIAL